MIGLDSLFDGEKIVTLGMRFRLERRMKRTNVCPRCEVVMDRRTSLPEAADRSGQGETEPPMNVGEAEIHHFLCIRCGNLTAIQFQEDA